MTDSNPCPGREEQVAALVDGGLPDAERAELLAHLAGCEVCHELLVEVLHLLEEEDAAPGEPAPSEGGAGDEKAPAGRLLTPPASVWVRRIRRAFPLAAVAILAVGLFWLPPEPARFDSATLVAPLVADGDLATKLGEGWADGVGSRVRGEGSTADDRPATSLQLGALVVRLRVALASEAPAVDLAWELASWLDTVPMTDVEAGLYDEIHGQLQAGEPSSTLLRAAADAEQALDKLAAEGVLVPAFYHLGKLAEAARLHALAGNAAFFEAPELTEGLAALRRELADAAPPALHEPVPEGDGQRAAHFAAILTAILEEK